MTAQGITFLFAATENASQGGSSEHMVTIFLIEVVLLLFFGRLLGEVMQRFGQPAVMGQLIAGVILGPSLFGHFFPHPYELVFPDVPAQKKMIDAISQVGILMLLLLTGIETDLKLVNKMRRTAIFTSLGGIILPFACGFILGEFLPNELLPNPSQRLVTALFLATALSISSVKIVAMVIMEVGFLRRNIGQIILSSAILDDTIGWIIIAIIGGMASGGSVNVTGAGLAFLGTIVFLAFSFTVGRRIISFLIRWTNDNLIMEMPVISVILVVMLLMALLTDFIGVHTVLGAFVVGILVGQSPILTKHIEEQLRGLIVAFFAPIFFAVAGREIDITVLNSGEQLLIALGFILIASVGKMGGAYIGGRLGSLGHKASTALAIGMNARGSTEVIVATIGLSLGVLNRDLFTLIVVMAISTTLITPPLLRWALQRIPPTGEEKERLEREEAHEKEFVPNIERILVAADQSANGKLASLLAGLFAGNQKVTATIMDFKSPASTAPKKSKGPAEIAKTAVAAGAKTNRENREVGLTPDEHPTVLVSEQKGNEFADAVLKEVENGYDIAFLGADRALTGSIGNDEGDTDSIVRILKEFKGVTALAVGRGEKAFQKPDIKLNILLPVTGTDYSRLAAEIAIALAKASGGLVTTLHVIPPESETNVLRRPDELIQSGRNIGNEIKKMGKREEVSVTSLMRRVKSPELAILRRSVSGKHNLMVLGVKMRSGERTYFGHRIAVLLERSECPILLINS